jgi:nucleotide-binding universal stress UspA family protein
VIKTILVAATGNDADLATFAAALAVARRFAAHLDMLHVRLDPVETAVLIASDGGSGAITGGLIERLEQDAAARETRARQLFEQFCAREIVPELMQSPPGAAAAVSAAWHVETGREARWMTAYGQTADLIVAPRGSGEDATPRSILETVLLESGRPLLIPAGSALPAQGERIAIAWKATAQAARAVAAAMPFLAAAREIAVLTVEEEGWRAGLPDGADRLAGNLARHGAEAKVERLQAGPAGAAATLLAAAADRADLLVMGGYGHSRLREWVFGGFTQQALADAALPLLIAH